jgi:hypothetical protein
MTKYPKNLYLHFLKNRAPWELDIEEVIATGRVRPIGVGVCKGMNATQRRAWSKHMNGIQAKRRKAKAAAGLKRSAEARAERNRAVARGSRRRVNRRFAVSGVKEGQTALVLLAMRPGAWHSAPELESAAGDGVQPVLIQRLAPEGLVEKARNAKWNAGRAAKGLSAGNPRFLWRLTPAGVEARELCEMLT